LERPLYWLIERAIGPPSLFINKIKIAVPKLLGKVHLDPSCKTRRNSWGEKLKGRKAGERGHFETGLQPA